MPSNITFFAINAVNSVVCSDSNYRTSTPIAHTHTCMVLCYKGCLKNGTFLFCDIFVIFHLILLILGRNLALKI